MVIFIFFSSEYILISLLIPSLTHVFFQSLLYNFQVVVFFSRDIFVTDFKLSSIVFKDPILYDLNPFKFMDTCFMAQSMVCLGNSFMCTLYSAAVVRSVLINDNQVKYDCSQQCSSRLFLYSLFFYFKEYGYTFLKKNYLAALDLRCGTWDLCCGMRGLSLRCACSLLRCVGFSLVVAHGLQSAWAQQLWCAVSVVVVCRLQSMWAQQLQCMGLVAPRHVGSQVPNQGSNRAPCIGRWILNHWAPGKSLLTHFCPPVLSVIERVVLKSLIIIVNKSVSPCSLISFYFMYFESLLRST